MTRCKKNKKGQKIQVGAHFRFGHILESMRDSEKLLKQKVFEMMFRVDIWCQNFLKCSLLPV
jgi:hypothetical protein